MSFQGNLRMYRERLGINAKDFAAQLGIKYTTYAGYETQGREPKYDILCKISAALNVSIDDLIGHTEHDWEYWQGYLTRLGISAEPSPEGDIVVFTGKTVDQHSYLGSFSPEEFLTMMEKITPAVEDKARNALREHLEIAISKVFNDQLNAAINDEIQRIAKSIKVKNNPPQK